MDQSYTSIPKRLPLNEFLPINIFTEKDKKQSYDLKTEDNSDHITLSYQTPVFNQKGRCGHRKFVYMIPQNISRNQETFEVLGLLQAEMGKKQDGKIVFCNHEYQLNNKVLHWFDKEFDFPKDEWKWYIKVNINEPEGKHYQTEIEEKVIKHWIEKTGLSLEMAYPKRVSYIKNTKNKKLRFYDYGTLIFEHRNNLFSQVIKNLVRKVFYNILKYSDDEIRWFMKGIIAGESTVEIHKESMKYRVFITANKEKERKLFQACLERLGIKSTLYANYKTLVISKKQNHLKLLEQKLMTLSPKKYSKFLQMINLYEHFIGRDIWRKNLSSPWNKTNPFTISRIIGIHFGEPNLSRKDLAYVLGISKSVVDRTVQDVEKILTSEI